MTLFEANVNERIGQLTTDELEWFAERFDESPSGSVIVHSYLLDKFRKRTGSTDSNAILKNRLIDLVNDAFF